MAYTVRKAQRSNAKPLLGFHCQSGGGKTYGALMLARSFVGPEGKIVMIETEEGRGEAYADAKEYPEIGGYEVVSMGAAGFSPEQYGLAMDAAEKIKPDALIIDSASHEWEGRGGVLAMAAANEAKGKKGMQVWADPKMDHNTHFMLRFMQTPIKLVILCMRSRYPMEQVKKDGKMEWVRANDLEPKQSEDILFEMFLHGWFERETHKFHIGKCTNKGLRDVFREGEAFTPETGLRLRKWSEGREAEQAGAKTPKADAGATTKTTSIELLNQAGGSEGVFDTWGAWLAAFEVRIREAGSPDVAQAIWDENSATFMRGQTAAEKAPAARQRFIDVGKLALEMRAPPGASDAQEPEGTQGEML